MCGNTAAGVVSPAKTQRVDAAVPKYGAYVGWHYLSTVVHINATCLKIAGSTCLKIAGSYLSKQTHMLRVYLSRNSSTYKR